jgi:hypothetical protein
MKPLTAIFTLLLFTISTTAQIVPIMNSLQTDIAKVISDYPNGFRNISGDQLMDNPQSVEFESKVLLKEAIKCRVFKFSAATKDIYSWEAEMLKTDDFDEASKKFRAIYNSIQNLSVNVNGANAVFKADFVKPSEEIKFTTIVFDTGEKLPELKQLKVALLLENEMMDWVVKIQVYEREREDKDRGRQIDR